MALLQLLNKQWQPTRSASQRASAGAGGDKQEECSTAAAANKGIETQFQVELMSSTIGSAQLKSWKCDAIPEGAQQGCPTIGSADSKVPERPQGEDYS